MNTKSEGILLVKCIVFLLVFSNVIAFNKNNYKEYTVFSIDSLPCYNYNFILLTDFNKDTILVITEKDSSCNTNKMIKSNDKLNLDINYCCQIHHINIDSCEEYINLRCSSRFNSIGFSYKEKSYTLYITPCLCGLYYIGCE